MTWIFQGQPFEQPTKEMEGFVYCITNRLTGKAYIGKKSFWSRRKPAGKSRRVTKESNWRNYYSSSDVLKSDVKYFGKENFDREILHLCKYKKQMSFLEIREQFQRDVLKDETYYNTNIAGKFFATEQHVLFNQQIFSKL